jgi:TfoX/Sxy family transcriptional regulator of competence genes
MKAQNDVGSVLVSSLAKIPGVVVKRKLTSANFTVRKKVFAFTKGDAVALKLPPETVKRLVEVGAASMLVMGKRTMKEWIVIRLKNPSDAKRQLRLFKEAIAFVSSKA